MKSILLLLMLSTALSGQTTIEGDVVDSSTGAPLAGAYVISRLAATRGVATTDSGGHFRLSLSFPYGRALEVRRAGFLTGHADVINPGRVALIPQAAISGKIVDEDGFPAENVVIQAMRLRQIYGQRELRSKAETQANDLGEYRFAGLPAGRYYLHMSNPGGRHTAQYYPGTLDLREASVIEVKGGDERGVDIRLASLEAARVTGQLVLPAGATSIHGVFVRMKALDSPDAMQYPASMRDDGSFTIPRVPPGAYMLRAAFAHDPGASYLQAEQRVEVGATDAPGIVLNAHSVAAVDLAGGVVFEGGAKPRPVVIVVHSESCPSISARSDETGSFVLNGLLPDHYAIQWLADRSAESAAASPIVISSIRLGDKELPTPDRFDLDGGSTGPLRLTFTAGVVLSAKVLDEAGRPAVSAMVAFLPVTGGRPTVSGQIGSDGTFKSWPMLAGDYRVYVAPDYNHWDLMEDPDYLKAHENDFPLLRVDAGANPPLTLRVPATQQ
jgi:hypothetical protein